MPAIDRFIPGVLCVAALAFATIAARAQEKATTEDRAAVAACLDKAQKAKADFETCIGVVEKPCLDTPAGRSTLGMKICAGREAAVWDEKLNKAYQALLRGDLGKTDVAGDGGRTKLTGADLIRDAQRAWISFRDKKCAAAGLPMQGGTGAGVLIGDCYLQETARQAIWLEAMVRGEE